MAKKQEIKDEAFEALISGITKQYGKDSVIVGNQMIETQRTSTGSLELDIATGGGFPDGRIIEIFGPESSGKTTLAIHNMVAAQKKYPNKRIGIIDAEHALDRKYCKDLGLNMDRVVINQPDNGEQGLSILESFVESGLFSVVLVDSVAALTPKVEIDGDMEGSSIGVHARLMGKALRKVTGKAHDTGTTIIFINQIREKIGVMYGPSETVTGGNALKFYASIRIRVSKKMGDKDGDDVKNIIVSFNIVKNKVAPPFRKGEYKIGFGTGIDRSDEILSIGVRTNLIKRSGAWYSFGETKLGNGKPAVMKMLSDNPELCEIIETTVLKNIDSIYDVEEDFIPEDEHDINLEEEPNE